MRVSKEEPRQQLLEEMKQIAGTHSKQVLIQLEQMDRIVRNLDKRFGSERIHIMQDTATRNVWWVEVDGKSHRHFDVADAVEEFLALTQKA